MIVLGIDAALTQTGVAVIEDGKAKWWATLSVEGEPDEPGPRYVKLREGIAHVHLRFLRDKRVDVIVIEKPEDGIREGHEAGHILKLFGAFAVVYAECARLWKHAHLIAVEPAKWKGPYGKNLTAGMMRAKYGVECANDNEWDALGLCDYGIGIAQSRKLLTDRVSGV